MVETFWEYILSIVDEPILNIVIGNYGFYEDEGRDTIPVDMKNVLLNSDLASPYLQYNWEPCYGAPKCHAIYIFGRTTSFIL